MEISYSVSFHSVGGSLVNNSSLLTWMYLQGLRTVVAVEDLLSLCDKVQRFINIGWALFCSEALIVPICFINIDIAVYFVLKWQRLAWLEILMRCSHDSKPHSI